jgi:hypothetical protein
VVEPADILSEMGEAYGYRIGRGLASGGWILHDLGVFRSLWDAGIGKHRNRTF